MRGDEPNEEEILFPVRVVAERPAGVAAPKLVLEREDGGVDMPVVGKATKGTEEFPSRGLHWVLVGGAEDDGAVGGIALAWTFGGEVDCKVNVLECRTCEMNFLSPS